ncbi:hypothetical protein PWG15_35515 (plasmid) [Ensifer adhaerens]|uniref:hypothetical protein n=1 Tax=Ensifer adhaerens TaxID=106592 RepID=UPI0023A99380|nr:hypothetical protein [Ensifer adhaerens]WDZ81645.1 hypothetical protein PWG15_35515 [Ensifer adhaerens]
MTKSTKSARSAVTGKVVTQPIGGKKAAKFAQVEGLKMNATSKALSQKLSASGLKGDAYRSEIVKAFKKG